jgi:hypothetical protein
MAITLGENRAPTPLVSTPAARPVARPAAPPTQVEREPSPFARLLAGLGDEVNRGEAMTKQAIAASRAGRDLGADELLALQAGVYRYSEAVDLAAKLVDRASSGVKTVLQGQ